MNKLLIVITLVIAGCAISPEQARSMSTYDLCVKANAQIETPMSKSAMQRLEERGEGCERYSGIIAARNANNAAILNAGVNQMNYAKQQQLQQQQIQLQQQQMLIQQRPVQVEVVRQRSFQESSPYR